MTDDTRHEKAMEDYRRQVRKTFQSMSMEALMYQDGIIRPGNNINRQEIEREFARRLRGENDEG